MEGGIFGQMVRDLKKVKEPSWGDIWREGPPGRGPGRAKGLEVGTCLAGSKLEHGEQGGEDRGRWHARLAASAKSWN